MTKDPVEHAAELDQSVRALIALHEGRVALVFEVATDHYKMTAAQAFEMAEGLIEAVMQTDPEPVITQIVTQVGAVPLAQTQPRIGTLADGRVVIDFRRRLNFIKLADAEVMTLAQGLIEMARLAKAGAHVVTGTVLNPHRRH